MARDLAKPHLKLVAPEPEAPRARDPLLEDRQLLVQALRRRDERAAAIFFREFEPLVERTIGRILGFGDELADATQETFLRAMRALDRLRDAQALVDWLIQIAVCTAADFLRRRKRRRWLLFFETDKLEEPPAASADEGGRDAVRATYRVLDRLSPEERTVFSLRFIEGMEIDALASAHDCSRSTVKRRLARATARFRALARREPALATWMAGQAAGTEMEEEP
jgi:RNA polymerase sigma-70 factor (ECF subfamily)